MDYFLHHYSFAASDDCCVLLALNGSFNVRWGVVCARALLFSFSGLIILPKHMPFRACAPSPDKKAQPFSLERVSCRHAL